MSVMDYPSKVERSSLHSASVHISSITEAAANPEPWQARLEGRNPTSREALNQDYLSPIKLVQLTSEPDLSKVSYLELTINTTENSVGNFGAHLPNLSELRFTDSSIPCVRDLGTSLSRVKVLWMARCKLKDLDGLPALQSLQEFYLSFNEVEDVSVITMLSALDVLDLESNNLSEEDQLGYLALCPSLTSLTLEGNPLSIRLAETTGGEAGYRAAIHEVVPGIKVLDDVPLSLGKEVGTELASRSSVFMLSEAGMKKDWRIIQESIKQGWQVEDDASVSVSPVARPMTAPPRRSLSISPTIPPVPADDESSNLTHGLSLVICGNPVRALRARKQNGLISQSTVLPHSPAGEPEELAARLQDFQLDLSSEQLTVTRAKSEENLFTETAQQPGHLFHTTPLPITQPISLQLKMPTSPQAIAGPSSPNATPPPSSAYPSATPPLAEHPSGPKRLPTRHPPPRRRLPTPPSTTPPPIADLSRSQTRPNSVADFRHKRYRKVSIDTPRSVNNST